MNTKTAQQIAIAFKRGLAFIRGIKRMAQDADPDEKWITIGAAKDEDGEKHGGRPVCISKSTGKIIKGLSKDVVGMTLSDAFKELKKGDSKKGDYTASMREGMGVLKSGGKEPTVIKLADRTVSAEEIKDQKRRLIEAHGLVKRMGKKKNRYMDWDAASVKTLIKNFVEKGALTPEENTRLNKYLDSMRKERDAKGTREYHQLDEITSKEYKPVADKIGNILDNLKKSDPQYDAITGGLKQLTEMMRGNNSLATPGTRSSDADYWTKKGGVISEIERYVKNPKEYAEKAKKAERDLQRISDELRTADYGLTDLNRENRTRTGVAAYNKVNKIRHEVLEQLSDASDAFTEGRQRHLVTGGGQTLITPVNHINLTQAEDLIDRAEKVLASVRKNEKLAPATEESITMEPVDFRTMRDRLDRVGARKITIPGVSEVMTSNGAWGSNGKRERFILGKDAVPEELIRYSTRWVTIGRGARIMVDSNGTIRAGLGGKYNGRQFADVFKAREITGEKDALEKPEEQIEEMTEEQHAGEVNGAGVLDRLINGVSIWP